MSREIAARSNNSDFLTGLFDDITATSVLSEMNLVDTTADDIVKVPGKRDAQNANIVFPVDDDINQPRKKNRLLSPLSSSSSCPSRPSCHNLAELSFPPLQRVFMLSQQERRCFGPAAAPAGRAGAIPLPHVSLSKKRVVTTGSSLSGVDMIGPSSSSSDGPHFILPDASSEICACSAAETNKDDIDCKFGWYVDLDNTIRETSKLGITHGTTSAFTRQVSLPLPLQEVDYQPLHDDRLAFQAPVAPIRPANKDDRAAIEWAMAMDAIDSNFGNH